MKNRLPIALSAALAACVGFAAPSVLADPPPAGSAHGGHGGGGGGNAGGGQHGGASGAPAGTAPAAGGQMTSPHPGTPPQGTPGVAVRGGAVIEPGHIDPNNNGHPELAHPGPGGGLNVGVNVGIGGGPGVVPVRRGPPIAYDDSFRRAEEQQLAARDAARRNVAVFEAQRAEREAEHRRLLETQWGPEFYRRVECREEIALNADRVAHLERIIDIASDAHNGVMVDRARRILARENARHAREMIALRIRLGYQ